MQFKDFFRIFRQRWHFFLAFFALIMLLYTLAFQAEEQQYQTTGKISIRVAGLEASYRYQRVGLPPYGGLTVGSQVDRIGDLATSGGGEILLRCLYRGEVRFEPPAAEHGGDERMGPEAVEMLLRHVGAVTGLLVDGVGDSLEPVAAFLAEAKRESDRWRETGGEEGSTEKEERVRGILGDWVFARVRHDRPDAGKQVILVSAISGRPVEAATAVNAFVTGVALAAQRESEKEWAKEGERLIEVAEWILDDLNAAERELQDHLTEERVRNLDDLFESVQDRERSLGEEREQMEGRIRESESARARLLRLRDARGPPVPDSADVRNLRSQLTQMQKDLEGMLVDYTTEHPDVRRRIAEMQRIQAALDEAVLAASLAEEREFRNRLHEMGLQEEFWAREVGRLDTAIEGVRKEMKDLVRLRRQTRSMQLKVDGLIQDYERINREIADRRIGQHTVHGPFVVESLAKRGEAIPLDRKVAGALGIVVLMALACSLGLVYLMEYLDTRIKTEHDVRRHLNLPVIARIEKRREGESVLMSELPLQDRFAESFNTAATLFRSAAQDLGLRTLVVTSTVPEEGKTTISINLGIALARKGYRVILVDSDLRRPQIHDFLGLDNAFGLSSVLEGRLQAREILGEVTGGEERRPGIEGVLHGTQERNLRVLTSGPIPPDPIQLLETVRMKALIEEMKGMADYVIFDTPPIFNVGDALSLAGLCDANLFVVGAMKVHREQVTWAKHLMSNIESNILGAVLNMETIESRAYYRYYYNYRYQSGKSVHARN